MKHAALDFYSFMMIKPFSFDSLTFSYWFTWLEFYDRHLMNNLRFGFNYRADLSGCGFEILFAANHFRSDWAHKVREAPVETFAWDSFIWFYKTKIIPKRQSKTVPKIHKLKARVTQIRAIKAKSKNYSRSMRRMQWSRKNSWLKYFPLTCWHKAIPLCDAFAFIQFENAEKDVVNLISYLQDSYQTIIMDSLYGILLKKFLF